MMKIITRLLSGFFVIISFVIFVNVAQADVWIGPPGNPPASNRPRPLDESGSTNTKQGSLEIEGDLTVGTGTGGSTADFYLSGDEQYLLQAATDGNFYLRHYTGVNWDDYFLTVDAGGQLGLGTNAPNEKLEVSDDAVGSAARLRITDDVDNPELQLHYSATDNNDHWALYVDQATDNLNVWGAGDTGDNRLILDTDGKVIVPGELCLQDDTSCIADWNNIVTLWEDGGAYIYPAGGKNVVIGEGEPTAQLVLPLSNDPVTPTLAFGDGDSGFYESADDTLQLGLAGSQMYLFSSSANVGISTYSSNAWLLRFAAAGPTTPNINPKKSDTDTGLGWAAADQLSLVAGGVEGLRVSEAAGAANVLINSGKVGIGASDPAEKLEVLDNVDLATSVARIRITDVNQNPEFQLQYGANGNQHWSFYVSNNDNDILRIWNDEDRLSIKTTGEVGIGSSDPSESLVVDDTTANAARIRVQDTSQNPEIQVQYGAGADEHWSVYAANTDDDSLRVWSPFSDLDALGDGDDVVTFESDTEGTVTFHGKIASDEVCLSGDCQTSWPATGAGGAIYTGKTISIYNGNNGGVNKGYQNADALCAGSQADSHVCTTQEILASVSQNLIPDERVWFFNGPPGYTAMANDCYGRTSSSGGDFGAIWLPPSVELPDGSGVLASCAFSYKIACCK